MMSAESFECRIPSTDAIKDAVINCSARPTNGWEIADFVLSLVVAAATVWAVLVALRSNRQALKQAEEDRALRIAAERKAAFVEASDDVIREFAEAARVGHVGTQLEHERAMDVVNALALVEDPVSPTLMELYYALDLLRRGTLEKSFTHYRRVLLVEMNEDDWRSNENERKKVLGFVADEVRQVLTQYRRSASESYKATIVKNFAESSRWRVSQYETNTAPRELPS
ncbi:hypothetical protein [Glutamicibacter sp. TV12E]|uniref:hypothetical protein n=1 Tax=Glutamicibacter sp. TV12E TaxID=3446362 RepID=UPI004034B969